MSADRAVVLEQILNRLIQAPRAKANLFQLCPSGVATVRRCTRSETCIFHLASLMPVGVAPIHYQIAASVVEDR